MNRRSLMQSIVALFTTSALPAKAEPQPKWDQYQWGREVVVCDGRCSFIMVPLLDGETPDNLVVSLIITHVFYGLMVVCETRLAELEAYHVGRPAALLVAMSRRELDFQASPLRYD